MTSQEPVLALALLETHFVGGLRSGRVFHCYHIEVPTLKALRSLRIDVLHREDGCTRVLHEPLEKLLRFFVIAATVAKVLASLDELLQIQTVVLIHVQPL